MRKEGTTAGQTKDKREQRQQCARMETMISSISLVPCSHHRVDAQRYCRVFYSDTHARGGQRWKTETNKQRAHAHTHLSLVRRSISHGRDCHSSILSELVREGQSGAQGDLRTDDAVAAVELALLEVHVHGTTLQPQTNRHNRQKSVRSTNPHAHFFVRAFGAFF